MGLNAVYGIEVAALRSFNVFGPRQDPSSRYSGVIPKFLSQALEACPVICGDSTQPLGGEVGDPGSLAPASTPASSYAAKSSLSTSSTRVASSAARTPRRAASRAFSTVRS